MSRFYAITYPIRFEDTMAYGSHHFLTNFRFQCAVRESLFFDYLGREYPGARAEYDEMVILTRDGYSRNLAPAMLGERVAVLMSLTLPTRSSIQLCIRTINEHGEPVACGFQTLVFMNRQGGLVPYPRALDRFCGENWELAERLINPSFATCIVGGTSMAAIFPDELRAIGRELVQEGLDGGKLIDLERAPALTTLSGDTVFSFPGQGSFDLPLFRELCHGGDAGDLIEAAEPIVRDTLRASLRALIEGDESTSRALLEASPDLDQFGIILTELLLARRMSAKGIRPAALIGHSFGEIAALCVASSITPTVAMQVIAERVRALRQLAGPVGGMAALSLPLARARDVLAELDTRSEINVSVVNDPRQTVLSGPRDYLEELLPAFAARRIGARMLGSRYAFHSPSLGSAARSFVMGLVPLPFGPPTIPVYSPILGRFYDASDAIQIAISSHLTRPVDFQQALQTLVSAGMSQIVECGGGNVLTTIVRRNSLPTVDAVTAVDLLAGATAPPVAAEPSKPIAKSPAGELRPEPIAVETAAKAIARGPNTPEPIAIISMGCVLPGANDPEHLWRNLLDGTSGILDLRTLDPTLEGDLIGGTQAAVVGDKSYSALAGHAFDVAWREDLPFTRAKFEGFSKAQRLLAEALLQGRLNSDPSPPRTLCVLGSTADGIAEYDDALFGAGARHALDGLNLPSPLHKATRDALDRLLPTSDPEVASPYPAYSTIVAPMLGGEVQTILLDAACASSLYALDLGVQALRSREADLAYVGGAFAPGPSSSALFAQFGGLSTTGSHALDERADGVVFGEGAAILGLRRLSDAVARGETPLAVITATGLASDGHSVAVNVPRAEGQLKAMKAAYLSSGIDIQSIQCVEAHATATPVGDATEVKALTTVFGGRDPSLPRIKLGSIKSLLGHTGWLAGATSVIKLVLSLQRELVPPHHDWTAPGPGIDLAESPFEILTAPQPWPRQVGAPRRAAVNGFGFGGTNAHVIIEDAPSDTSSRQPTEAADIVCVGFGAAFVGETAILADRAEGRAASISTDAFRMPRRKLLMPDAIEQMDAAQFTVLTGVDRALEASGIDLAAWKERIGIVIGTAGKARRGVAASQRILADRLHRRLTEKLVEAGHSAAAAASVADALSAQLKTTAVDPCNAYTLVGMMPNLVAGRAVNVFGLMGPSLVVDTGPQSLLGAMRVAQSYLNHRVCDVVLTGGVNATAPWPRAGLAAGDDGSEPDGAAVLALTRRETAVAHGLPIVATVVATDEAVTITPTGVATSAAAETRSVDIPNGRPHEVGGIAAVAAYLHEVGSAPPARRFQWSASQQASIAEQTAERLGYLRDERTISFYERLPVSAPLPAASATIPDHVLLITDRPKLAEQLKLAPGFERASIRCMVPDPAGDEKKVAALDPEGIGLVLVARDLRGVPPSSLLDLDAQSTALLDLAFLVVRHLNEAIGSGQIPLLSLHLNGWPADTLHPDAALFHGMLKSLARDWPSALVRAVVTDTSDLAAAATAIARELTQPGCDLSGEPTDVEVVEISGRRHALRFTAAVLRTTDDEPQLDNEAVVVLTGGARGVTAVMADALLERYGCRLVLLGRSDPEIVPQALRSLSLDDMERYETEYYRSERQRDPKRSIPELKREFIRLKAAHETLVTTEELRRRGKVEFKIVDITDPQRVDAVIRDIVAEYGSVDLVVHGAGLQISRRLASRQLREFQQVIGTKLYGLRNLVAACTRHVGPNVPFHILTSAFSAIGNDGQPDYGAANEAMAALACVHDGPVRWTALGWLGWAAVGMTRGSEYAALGNSRGLRAVLPEEGKALFLELMASKSRSAAVSLLSEGEVKFYHLPIARSAEEPPAKDKSPPKPTRPRRDEIMVEFPLSTGTAPYLNDHLVNGSPALPGTFEVEFALRAARKLRPEHAHFAVRNPKFHRFVRVPEQGTCLRAETKIVEEKADGSVIGVRLLSDFIHRSGLMLKRDVLHFEVEVLTSRKPFLHSANGWATLDMTAAVPCADPYLAPGSPVKLGGMFACLDEIRIGSDARSARYHIGRDTSLDSLEECISPVLLLDALFRLVGVAPDSDVSNGTVSVPLSGDTFYFTTGLTDRVLQGTALRMIAANPRSEGEFLRTDWGHVIDAEGHTIVSIAGAFARRMGKPAPALSAA